MNIVLISWQQKYKGIVLQTIGEWEILYILIWQVTKAHNPSELIQVSKAMDEFVKCEY